MDRLDEQPGTAPGAGLLHAGAGTGLFLVQLSVIIPGLLPTVALLGVFAAVVVLPLLALGLLAAVLAGPPYALWRLAARSRRRRSRVEARERAMPAVAHCPT